MYSKMKKILFLILFGISLMLLIAEEEAPGGEPVVNDGLIFVEGGAFQMGSSRGETHEMPVHAVQISSFYISPFEVTQSLWQTVMKGSISNQRARMKPAGRLRGKGRYHPMYFVSWYEAIDFCNRLSQLNKLDPCYSGSGEDLICDFTANGYRLPTEAEWEYAARGGQESRKYNYAGSNSLDVVAWYNGNSALKAQEVGHKVPNELGLYDLSGNVYEWCWDRFSKYSAEDQIDPSGSGTMDYRVFRGGSWSHGAEYSRNSFRLAYPPERRGNNLGFRMVRTYKKDKF